MSSFFVKKHRLLNKNLSEWFKVYNEFSKIEPCAINVLDVNKDYITMESIDLSKYVNIIEYLNNYNTHANKVSSKYFKIISNILLFQDSYPFIYFDLHRGNIMVNTDNGDVILLDPDSFFFYNPNTFYAPGKDKDTDSMIYFEVRLKFLNFTAEVLNSYFTNNENWKKHKKLTKKRKLV